MNKKIRVLIVDDSSVIRTLLTKVLSSDPDIEVVGTAPDPYFARDKLITLKPDVMTLDIEMPKMDGITFLGKVMQSSPVRTLIFSSLSTKNSLSAMKAIEAGAIDVMAKPAIDVTKGLSLLAAEITAKVKMVARANLVTNQKVFHAEIANKQKLSALALQKTTHQIIAIASSTGGTEALKEVLPYLPEDLPGTVIVQHMPPVFTKTYAECLDRICPFEVKEAEHGDRVIPGRVLIAPGNFHMELTRSGAYYSVKLHQEPSIHGVRPAADYLMKSVAKYAGSNAVGVVLTGMGKDGAEGLLAMKNAGSYNIAQDEKSCIVYGMPKAAVDINAVHRVLSLEKIAADIIVQIKDRAVA
ncbi:MAG: chemotaxis response regulator protein-glutamate methylesterase [Bdellovibrionota bacterium]